MPPQEIAHDLHAIRAPAISGQVLLAYAQLPAPDAAEPAAPAPAPAGTTAPVAGQPPSEPATTAADPAARDADGEYTDIVVVGRGPAPREDPMQAINLGTYKAVQAVDNAIIAPVAMAYKDAVPSPVRKGIANFFDNLDEPVVFLAFLLQLKPGKALETLGRFAINSTLGIGGLIDVAKNKPFNLPRRSNGIADTLGYYGIGPGPYLVVPTIGPTTLRDLLGRIVDTALVPRLFGKPFNKTEYQVPKGVIQGLNYRIASDDRITRLRDRSDDGYGAIRREYLERRQREIDVLKGLRANGDPDPLPTEAAPAAPPASAVAEPAPVPAAPAAPSFIAEPVVQPLPAA